MIRSYSVPIQPQIPIKVNIAQPRQKLHVVSSREQRLEIFAWIRGHRRNHQALLREQAIENFPQSHHSKLAHPAIAIVRAYDFESRHQHTQLLYDRGPWKRRIFDAELVVLQELNG